jgi:SAM-dependent methyltransferase
LTEPVDILQAMAKSVDESLTGEFLYGDDFPPELVKQWFDAEQTAYFELAAANKPYVYGYHALHWQHGYRFLPRERKFPRVLGIGSARGEEFDGIRDRCEEITIVEPAEGFQNSTARYVKPSADGALPFSSGSFDLITCFGVLHHICNVSVVFAEIARCLAPDGYLLVSEPMTSMGDWRNPRKGLSANERGIPLPAFRKMIEESGLRVDHESYTEFRPLVDLSLACGVTPYNSRILTKLDAMICSVLPHCYHARTRLEKIRPVGAYFVLQR